MRCLLALNTLLLGSFLALSPSSARDCTDLDREARAAETADDGARLKALFAESADPLLRCPERWRASFGEDIANHLVGRFFAALEKEGKSPASMRAHLPLLEEAGRYGETWQLLLTRAEAHFELEDYDRAAPLYQNALTKMAGLSAEAAKDLPDEKEFALFYGRMAEANLLARDYDPPPLTRGETPGGLFIERWRGYTVKAVPLPIQFEFASTAFTEKGTKAARHLLAYLKGAKPPRITLVGHTDPIGSEGDNLDLSTRRAGAVRDFLLANGYAGTISIIGKGESEPFQPVAPARYLGKTEDQYALDRRVELIR